MKAQRGRPSTFQKRSKVSSTIPIILTITILGRKITAQSRKRRNMEGGEASDVGAHGRKAARMAADYQTSGLNKKCISFSVVSPVELTLKSNPHKYPILDPKNPRLLANQSINPHSQRRLCRIPFQQT